MIITYDKVDYSIVSFVADNGNLYAVAKDKDNSPKIFLCGTLGASPAKDSKFEKIKTI